MLEYIGLILIISAIFAVLLLHKSKPQRKCDTCRYYRRNTTQEPCIYCNGGSEWRESMMEGQEDWD